MPELTKEQLNEELITIANHLDVIEESIDDNDPSTARKEIREIREQLDGLVYKKPIEAIPPDVSHVMVEQIARAL